MSIETGQTGEGRDFIAPKEGRKDDESSLVELFDEIDDIAKGWKGVNPDKDEDELRKREKAAVDQLEPMIPDLSPQKRSEALTVISNLMEVADSTVVTKRLEAMRDFILSN